MATTSEVSKLINSYPQTTGKHSIVFESNSLDENGRASKLQRQLRIDAETLLGLMLLEDGGLR